MDNDNSCKMSEFSACEVACGIRREAIITVSSTSNNMYIHTLIISSDADSRTMSGTTLADATDFSDHLDILSGTNRLEWCDNYIP